MQNIEMMKGTQGTPDFVVIGDLEINGAKMRVGIRPLYQGGIYGATKFGLIFNHRIRIQVDSGGTPSQTLGSLLKTNQPVGMSNDKVKGDYASFMMMCEHIGTVGKDLNQDLVNHKQQLRQRLDSMFDFIMSFGTKMRYTKTEVVSYFMAKACVESGSIGVDLGDFTQGDVPTEQPFAKKMQKIGGQPAPSVADCKKNPPVKKSEPKPAEPDKYAQKDLSDDDLSNMSFDQLMGAISKKAGDDKK